jgi:hypothetical protein
LEAVFLVEEKELNEARKARRREFLARNSARNVAHAQNPSAKRNFSREEEKDLKRKDNISPKGLYV